LVKCKPAISCCAQRQHKRVEPIAREDH
jgi:hypothetical protein